MEQRSFLMSALGVGLSVGVGLGVGRWTAQSPAEPGGLTAEKLEAELMKQVIDGKEGDVCFHRFPYYLSDQTHAVLTSAAFVHLKQAEISKYTRKLSPASRAILLSGPAELYQQMLAKALAHHFEAKLLLLDITDFSLKMQSKYGNGNKDSLLKRSISEAAIERMSGLFESFSLLSPREEPKVPLCRQGSRADLRARDGNSKTANIRRNDSCSVDMNDVTSQSGSVYKYDSNICRDVE